MTRITVDDRNELVILMYGTIKNNIFSGPTFYEVMKRPLWGASIQKYLEEQLILHPYCVAFRILLTEPLSKMPLYINSVYWELKLIAQWRLKKGK